MSYSSSFCPVALKAEKTNRKQRNMKFTHTSALKTKLASLINIYSRWETFIVSCVYSFVSCGWNHVYLIFEHTARPLYTAVKDILLKVNSCVILSFLTCRPTSGIFGKFSSACSHQFMNLAITQTYLILEVYYLTTLSIFERQHGLGQTKS